MEMYQTAKTALFIFLTASFGLAHSTFSAEETMGLYTNGQWDPACNQCWPAPRTASNNHCRPQDCAIQGYYHCKMQDPPLAIDDDPRLVSLIQSGQCTYVPRSAMNEGESQYVQDMQVCSNVLDSMAGRFSLPADPQASSRKKLDFYLAHLKAMVLGSAYAQLNLAIDYDIGMGTTQNREKATKLFEEAAQKGLPFAQYAIAARYAYGISVPKDKDAAIKWLKKALDDKPPTAADLRAKAIVTPCAIKLIERLTPM